MSSRAARLLLINPNTTAAMTRLMLSVAKQAAGPRTRLTAVTGRFGARYIASRAAAAIAGHAALDALANHRGTHDVVVLACFGDPGLLALRELSPKPVIGMAEASMQLASRGGKRFGIVTGGERWGPMLEEFAALLGFAECLTKVRTVAPTGADIARDPEAAYHLLVRACRAVANDGAESVILGGAGLAGIAAKIQPRVPIRVIDSTVAVVKAAEALAGKPGKRDRFGRTPTVESIGLSPELKRMLEPHH